MSTGFVSVRHVASEVMRETPGPQPSSTAIVNAYDAVLARPTRCQAERGRKPTILAVDFYRTGDLIGVVRALNQ